MLTKNALTVLEKRYLRKDEEGNLIEDPEGMFRRVASAVAEAELNYGASAKHVEGLAGEFYEFMANLEFLPNSPTLMNAGRDLGQLSACFVLPIDDSMESIFETVKNTALIHKSGGGTGFSFSRLRPAQDVVKSTNGVSSGPVSFMQVFNAATEAIKQGGTRRGANMGCLRVDHPDILEFITCKQNTANLTNFNISVLLTEEFMEAVVAGRDYDLISPRTGRPVKTLNAAKVFDLIVNMAWANGEPGVIFIDRVNRDNPTPHLGEIESTNPCVTGDTLIYTDSGLRRIADLYREQNLPMLTLDSRFLGVHSARTARIVRTGTRQVFRLRTVEGYEVRLTADHKVKTNRGWIPASQLTRGDRIHILDHKGGFGTFGSERLGLLLGWLVGSGTAKAAESVLSFWSEEKHELASEFAEMMAREVDGSQMLNHEYGMQGGEIQGEDEYLVKSRQFWHIAAEHGLTPVDKHRVPETVLAGSEEMQRGFLRALFTADGYVSGTRNKGVSVRLTSINRDLLLDVQRMLLNFGIPSALYRSRKPHGLRDMPDGEGGVAMYLCNGYGELVITKDALASFANEIGFLTEAKQAKLLAALEGYTCRSHKQDFTAQFLSLDPDGVETVYDITEPLTHSFVANGLVVHNCGEQPLLPYESCNLGSINLARMVTTVENRPGIDWERLGRTVRLAVRFLDNVIDVNRYPLEQIARTTRGNRKIGLGVMGFADMLIQLGVPYDSEEGISIAEQVMSFISNEGKKASCELAKERGVFPNFEGSIYDRPDGMEVRNATVTTIAPTGTLSIIAGCSSGIEPLFAISYVKRVMDGAELLEVNPYFEKVARERGFYSDELMRKIAERGGVRGLPQVPEDVQRVFATALDISPTWHVRMQAAFQRFTDNAVSKTVNFPEDATPNDVRQVYELAYREGCKGCTIYRYGSRESQVLNVAGKEKKTEESATGAVRGPRPRPTRTYGSTECISTGCGKMYVTINEDDKGLCEVFVAMGKTGGCNASQLEAIGRLISLSLRAGVDPHSIHKHLRGIRCQSPAWGNGGAIMSCADAIGVAIQHYLEARETGVASDVITKPSEKLDVLVGACPDCGSAVEHESGCVVCRFCGFSRCG
ncbi:MAG: adenosylcobalamin-dependent ribonucleoside-diphosphate reductase [Armatimonadetes bacterium]|nr:adenosylcobalamin-dependent ribonucleoside-diphosphate reductase [Armatimonadota bacterium]